MAEGSKNEEKLRKIRQQTRRATIGTSHGVNSKLVESFRELTTSSSPTLTKSKSNSSRRKGKRVDAKKLVFLLGNATTEDIEERPELAARGAGAGGGMMYSDDSDDDQDGATMGDEDGKNGQRQQQQDDEILTPHETRAILERIQTRNKQLQAEMERVNFKENSRKLSLPPSRFSASDLRVDRNRIDRLANPKKKSGSILRTASENQ